MVMSHLMMRKCVGWLGFWLPVVLYFGGLFTERCVIPSSISAYYHSVNPVLQGVFVGTLCAIGVFLICYKGYPREGGEWLSDNWITTAAGSAAIGVAIVPTLTRHCRAENTADGVLSYPEATFGGVHLVLALVFFAALALMCFFLFTKTASSADNRQKAKRNNCYRLCGWVIVATIAAIALVKLCFNDQFIWVFLLGGHRRLGVRSVLGNQGRHTVR